MPSPSLSAQNTSARPLAQGRGVVMVTAHTGAWDAAARWLAARLCRGRPARHGRRGRRCRPRVSGRPATEDRRSGRPRGCASARRAARPPSSAPRWASSPCSSIASRRTTPRFRSSCAATRSPFRPVRSTWRGSAGPHRSRLHASPRVTSDTKYESCLRSAFRPRGAGEGISRAAAAAAARDGAFLAEKPDPVVSLRALEREHAPNSFDRIGC